MAITGHGGGDAGQDHGDNSHEHGVDHPAQGSRSGGSDREVDGIAVGTEACTEGNGQLPQGGALSGKQLW